MVSTRRSFLTAAGALAAAGAGGCLGSSASHPVSDPVTAWRSFRGDRYNTGYAREVAPTASDPAVDWRYETDGPIWSSPAVVDDTVYIGSGDGGVYALAADSGERRWRFGTDNRVESTPAVADGTVYVGSYDMGVYAIDADSGEKRWSRTLGGLVRGSPTVVDGTVYVGVGCYNLACAGPFAEADAPETGWMYALDAASGETRWQQEVGTEVVSTPAVVEGTVYVGASDGVLYAFDAGSGDVAWTYEALKMIWAAPAVAFDTVYVADWDAHVHAVAAGSGQRRWRTDTEGQYISGSVAVDDDWVYVGHTPRNPIDDPTTNHAKLFRLDRTDGTIDWAFETEVTEIGSSPVVTEDTLYVGTHRQQPEGSEPVGVHGFTTDGREEWFLPVGGVGVGSSPALLDGTLYFGGTDGAVYAVA